MTEQQLAIANAARLEEGMKVTAYRDVDEMLKKFEVPLVFMLSNALHIAQLDEVNRRIGNTADEIGRVVLGKMDLSGESKLVTLSQDAIEVFDTFTPQTKEAELVVGSLASGLVIAEVLPDNLNDPCMVMYKLVKEF